MGIYVNVSRTKVFRSHTNVFYGLEQVHVRCMNRRFLRLELAASLGMTLAVLPAAAQMATQTALNVETRDLSGRTQATASVTVTGADGLPASGVVNLVDGDRQLSQVALDGKGEATTAIGLLGGNHALRAVYSGDTAHQQSTSVTSSVAGQTGTPNFSIALSAVPPFTLPLNVSAGNTGTVAVTIVPQNNAALTGPMFVTLSCSGLPELATCAFTPESLEILPSTPASCPSGSPVSSCPPISSMLIQTQAEKASRTSPVVPGGRKANPIAWATLLPGILGLGGLAFGVRRRSWLSRLTLVALLGLVTMMGTTACAPLYNYYHHGPTPAPATPTGTFNVTVTAQSSDGVTAITNSTTMVLTIQ